MNCQNLRFSVKPLQKKMTGSCIMNIYLVTSSFKSVYEKGSYHIKQYFATILCLISILSLINIFPISYALKYGSDQDISKIPDKILGENSTNDALESISISGDVNGDGFDDMLIGVREINEGGKWAGKTYILFGRSSGWGKNISASSADASFIGEEQYDGSGYSVSIIGDVNGDGYDDFLIGAPAWVYKPNTEGKTYLIYGRSTGWIKNVNLSTAQVTLFGENKKDCSGRDVAGVGDVNGDGYKDFLISSEVNNEGGSFAGKVYLFLGGKFKWLADANISSADATFIGKTGENAGSSISGVGDVNGDGFDDFIIGAYSNDETSDDAGKAYLIFGKASGWTRGERLAKANASFRGIADGDMAGSGVAGVGDVNGDGFDDFLIGAQGKDGVGYQSGASYLIFGKKAGWARNISLSTADASFEGEGAHDYVGDVNRGAGDVNGDGFDDFLISSPYNDEYGNDTGQTYLILGKATGWKKTLNISQVDASFIRTGGQSTANSIGGGGDINGDGYDDVLIGVNTYVPRGTTYIIFPDSNSKPLSIGFVKAYFDSGYITEISKAFFNDTIYLELRGTDGNSSRRDIATVSLTSSKSSPHGFILRLFETGPATGIYRGNFSIKDRTHEEYHWIAALGGEVVKIASTQDPSKSATIQRSVAV